MDKKTVLVTGATGFIGRHFCQSAVAKGFNVIALVRDVDKAKQRLPDVSLVTSLANLPTEKIHYVVNMAGEPLAKGRWNEKRKQAFLESRVNTTNQLFDHFKSSAEPPDVLISGSAVGYYGP